MRRPMLILLRLLLTSIALTVPALFCHPANTADVDGIVIGSGIGGLATALEAGRGGARVLVIDMASVFGGHAVMAQGLLNITGTPVQEAQGIKDSPELAERDFLAWGEDANHEWVRYYTRHARTELYDWLVGLGVEFEETLQQPPGNSVPRGHRVHGRGVGLVTPIFRECLATPTISFRWNVRLDRLLRSNGRLCGVAVTDLRTGATAELRAPSVVLAAGGFQSTLALVRQVWRKDLPIPERILAGSGINSMGSALPIAQHEGAVLERLDHQWNYVSGVPDPRFPGTDRGLSISMPSIWLNRDGQRFVRERSTPKDALPRLLQQPGGTYWAIFGPEALHRFYVSGSDWGDYQKIQQLIIGNPTVTLQAGSFAELSQKTGLPQRALQNSVVRFNAFVATGTDEDFGLFDARESWKAWPVSGPPYFAIQFYPLARKSLGGVAVDTSCKALVPDGTVIPGLYAVGEVSGFGGINGKKGLEGTFLGPALVMGRVAARAILADLGRKPAEAPRDRAAVTLVSIKPKTPDDQQCLACHDLPLRLNQSRPGYWHFENVHRVVLEQQFSCSSCHAEVNSSPALNEIAHRIDRRQQLRTCGVCHRGESP